VSWLKLEIAFVIVVFLFPLAVVCFGLYLHLIARKEEDEDDLPN
jgi:hypothetical protein